MCMFFSLEFQNKNAYYLLLLTRGIGTLEFYLQHNVLTNLKSKNELSQSNSILFCGDNKLGSNI